MTQVMMKRFVPGVLLLLLLAGGGVYVFRDRIAWDGLFDESLATKLERLEQSDADGDGLFGLAMAAFLKGESGVGLEAINLAAQRGSQDAKLEMVRWYDPRTFAAGRVAAMDANRAARTYFELAFQGSGEAENFLISLCEESRKAGSPHTRQFEDFLASTYCDGIFRQ